MTKTIKIGETKSDVMDFAGSWRLSDEETKEIELALRGIWKNSRIKELKIVTPKR